MKLSILFYPNKEKKNNKTGKIPMYMRITLNREKAEMRLNIELSDAELLKWDETVMRFADRDMSANAYINEIDKNFEEFYFPDICTKSSCRYFLFKEFRIFKN